MKPLDVKKSEFAQEFPAHGRHEDEYYNYRNGNSQGWK